MKNQDGMRKLTLRLTENEYALFHEKFMESRQKTYSGFFVEILNHAEIVTVSAINTEALVELKKQGINLNQLVRHANERGVLTDIQTTLENVNAVYQKLYELEVRPWPLSGKEEDQLPNLLTL